MSSQTDAKSLADRLDELYEYEREPIAANKLEGGRHFAALFAGEHVAATEFVIGALFVLWGVTARDLIWGLILGNALAVLSWAFICAPIATRVRLTLYWYVRRIIGPALTVLYNVVNAMLYCCLAAAMIGVSASAIFVAVNKLGMHLKHPTFEDVLPNSVGWVVVVLLVGAVVVTLAIAGFKKLAQFASVCSPWMFLVFIAGAIASLPRLGEVKSFGDFWQYAETKVWTGRPAENPLRVIESALPDTADGEPVPQALREELAKPDKNWFEAVFKSKRVELSDAAALSAETPGARWSITDGEARYVIKPVTTKDKDGTEKTAFTLCTVMTRLGFWHIMFFAWFCNLAMHVGLSDMAIFRYARHWSYGFYSTFGMYLGHFLAWICAGIMGGVAAAGLNPGEMADNAAGFAGVLAVLIAGWTTANPTIYRAGLALQIITPNWPRWKVTLAAGGTTALVGCFPAIFMQLLDFVAIYGLVLMPIGAVIVVEHWLFPKLGLQQYWAEKKRVSINRPALLSWAAVLVLCFPIEQFTHGRLRSPMEMLGVHLFFRWLPGWFIAGGLYVVLCYAFGTGKAAAGASETEADFAARRPTAAFPPKPKIERSMKFWLSGSLAIASLAACIALPIWVCLGGAENYDAHMETYKLWFLVATATYFVGAITLASQREKARPTTA
ncbi:MAG: hypothetical protein JXA69_06135 [Phycisphaerae bacterium]|nr:hypothetical protein [Phycisphaerae bacterium]